MLLAVSHASAPTAADLTWVEDAARGSLLGRTAIVTGATRGIGLAKSSKVLHIVTVCNRKKGFSEFTDFLEFLSVGGADYSLSLSLSLFGELTWYDNRALTFSDFVFLGGGADVGLCCWRTHHTRLPQHDRLQARRGRHPAPTPWRVRRMPATGSREPGERERLCRPSVSVAWCPAARACVGPHCGCATKYCYDCLVLF